MTSWISATPNPAQVGDTVTVCYDFVGSEQDGKVTISVTFDGEGGGQSIQVDALSPCTTITVPKGCTSILLEDMTGSSGDLVVVVLP